MTSKPRYVGILTDQYVEYQRNFVDTISQIMESSGYGTLCITSRNLELLQNPSPEQLANSVFPPAKNSHLSGLICLSGTLAHNFDLLRLDSFLQKYALPTVSLGFQLPSFPSIIVDDKAGMSQLMGHLLANKKRKSFAFVRGYPGDPYSTEREDIFRQCLSKSGLEISEACFLEGNYDQYQSYVAVSDFLKFNTEVDVIVAANDVMALSAARAVASADRNIPNDVIVTGFDDTAEATQHSPAITTVRQPTTKMAKSSAELLLSMIQSRNARTECDSQLTNEVTLVKSELVIRSSSRPQYGNDGESNRERTSVFSSIDGSWLDVAMSGLRKPENIDLDSIREAVAATVNHGDTSLEECLQKLAKKSIRVDDVHWWNNLCFHLELFSENALCSQDKSRQQMNIVGPLSTIREKLWSASLDQSFEFQRLQSERANLQLQISSCTNITDITRAMDRWLELVDVKRFFLVRYEAPQSVPNGMAILMHVYKRGEKSNQPDTPFSSIDVLPDNLADELNTGQLVLSPVYAGNLQYGYLLIDPTGIDLVQIDSTAQCIGNAMRNHHLIQTLEKRTHSLQTVNKELSNLANFDSLTGLPNRLNFQRFLTQKCDSSAATQSVFSVMFMDLDGFKLINDTLGHTAGDELLKAVTDRLLQLSTVKSWSSAMTSRLGGDEFTFILDISSDVTEATQFADAVLELMSKQFLVENQSVRISASIGCAVFPKDGQDSHTLLKHADTAMYHAKEQGKNRIVLFSPEIGNESTRLHKLDQAMRNAMTKGEIDVFYQPRFDMGTDTIRCIEAGRHWTTELDGSSSSVVSAQEIDTVAERSGFIAELDLFTLKKACSHSREWAIVGFPTRISVKISSSLLQRKEFRYTILDLLNRCHIDPILLELEISESVLLNCGTDNLRKLDRLCALGVQLSIGSFRNREGATQLVVQLPVDNIKIDPTLIAATDEPGLNLVHSIINLCNSLNIKVVAAGVETADQLDTLSNSGCDQISGAVRVSPLSEQAIREYLIAAFNQKKPPAAA